MNSKTVLNSKTMKAVFDKKRGGLVSLTSPYDDYKTEFLLTPEEFPEYDIDNCQWLGHISGQVKVKENQYKFSTGVLRDTIRIEENENHIKVEYPDVKSESRDLGFSIQSVFSMENELFRWKIRIKNNRDTPLIFSDLNIPLLMNQYFRMDDEFKYDRCALRHTCITGHSSYLYWEKSSGNSPVLLLAPLGDNVLSDLKRESPGSVFGPKGGEGYGYEGLVRAHIVSENPAIPFGVDKTLTVGQGDIAELQFGLSFLENEKMINHTLDEFSLTTLKAVPGMVAPITEDFFIMTRPVSGVVSVYDSKDKILESNEKNGWRVTCIRFGDYGRRYVQVNNENNVSTYCFFITEPIESIIDSHAQFITKNHLETNPEDPCYHGLLIWDMINKERINSTFNPYFEDWWRGGSDDPGLVSGLFLSEKNVYRPVNEEINVLNDYVEDFILKRLTEQPGWRVHRMVPWYTMFEPWAGRGADDVWRAFNYVHVINTMRNMYLIQKQNGYSQLREATQYLRMAYEYKKAMFNYWMFPDGVGASEFGNMGEMILALYLDADLRREGFIQEATELAAIFDKKSAYFNSKKFPFGSEMVYDSTAFEAVYGYGKRINSNHIMTAAARASYSNRGKQPVWYLYCTDLRAGGDTSWNTSYMTQLGAYPILDYTLHQGHIDEDWIMTYYGAYLSGWLIYNSGGYWSNDEENSGATGWITDSSHINFTGQSRKGGFPYINGLVALSGEAALGFFGALRTACSIVIDHSVLGRIGLGCHIRNEEGQENILLKDGISTRFYHVPGRWRVEVDRDRISRISVNNNAVKVEVSSLVSKEHVVTLKVYTIPENGKLSDCIHKFKLKLKNQNASSEFEI